MSVITAAQPLSFVVREESKALARSVAITVGFMVAFTAAAPLLLLAGIFGSPIALGWLALRAVRT